MSAIQEHNWCERWTNWRLWNSGYRVGKRVKLLRDVERFPQFIAKAGMTGTITETPLDDAYGWGVQMDDKLENCEEWGNQVLWFDHYLADFEADVALL